MYFAVIMFPIRLHELRKNVEIIVSGFLPR